MPSKDVPAPWRTRQPGAFRRRGCPRRLKPAARRSGIPADRRIAGLEPPRPYAYPYKTDLVVVGTVVKSIARPVRLRRNRLLRAGFA